MSLVGERAEDRLPEYAQVLQRVISSKDHDSFRVRLNDRPCVIFSSETSNRWYLILSVDTDVLYAESDRQMAAMGAINLLMLVVVLTCAAVSARSRQRAAQSVSEGTAFLSGLAIQLRQLSARILRLNDQRLHEEGSDPAELAEHLNRAVEQICVIIGGQCADKGLRFHSDTQGNLDAHFLGDDLKLKQSLINILGNCVKFTEPPAPSASPCCAPPTSPS
jgi:signal transduction histidine kinase